MQLQWRMTMSWNYISWCCWSLETVQLFNFIQTCLWKKASECGILRVDDEMDADFAHLTWGNLARWKRWKYCSFLRKGSNYGPPGMTRLGWNAEFIRRQRPRSLIDMFEGSYGNTFRFGSQLWDFCFGTSCCTSIHTFLFIFSVLLYVWALGLAVRLRC